MSGKDMSFDKELVVIFGGETQRRHYINQNKVDPMRKG